MTSEAGSTPPAKAPGATVWRRIGAAVSVVAGGAASAAVTVWSISNIGRPGPYAPYLALGAGAATAALAALLTWRLSGKWQQARLGRSAPPLVAERRFEAAAARAWRLYVNHRREAGRHLAPSPPLFVISGPAVQCEGGLARASGVPLLHEGFIRAGEGLAFQTLSQALILECAAEGDPAAPSVNAWNLCLSLMRRGRWRQALQGVVLQVTVQQLDASRENVALWRAWAAAIGAMQARARREAPVYIFLSGVDAIPGLWDWLAAGDKDASSETFGVALPEEPRLDPGEAFRARYRIFLQWQAQQALAAVANDTPQISYAAYMFPSVLARLEAPLSGLVEAFRDVGMDGRAMSLRGVYFVSAPPPGGGAGCFVEKLATGLLMPQAAAARSARCERAATRRAVGATVVAAAILCAIALPLWGVGFWRAETFLIAAGAGVREARSALDPGGSVPAGLPAMLKAMNALQRPLQRYLAEAVGDTLYERSGMAAPQAAARAMKLRYGLLQRGLVSQLASALEQRLHEPQLSQDDAFAALSAYRRLVEQPDRLDDEDVKLLSELCLSGPGAGGAADSPCRSMASHLRRITTPVTRGEAKARLLAGLRRRFHESLLPAHGVDLLAQEPEAAAFEPWRIPAATLALAARGFAQPDPNVLNKGVSGIYTARAFPVVTGSLIPRIAQRLASQEQMLQPRDPATPVEQVTAFIASQMLDIYADRYIVEWRQVVEQATLRRSGSERENAGALEALISTPSPLSSILKAAARETSPEPASGEAVMAEWRNSMQDAATRISTAFANLRRFTQGQPSALDNMMQALQVIYSALVSSAGNGGPDDPGRAAQDPALAQAANALRQNSVEAPPGLALSAQTLAEGAAQTRGKTVLHALDREWREKIVPFYDAAIAGRYPFARSSAPDMTIADFTRFFGPGGLLDNFGQRLASATASGQVHPSPAATACMKSAAQIRAMLFPPGATSPSLTFTLSLPPYGKGADRIELTIGGQTHSLTADEANIVPATWPGTAPGIRVVFPGTLLHNGLSRTWSSPWALFRFLGDSGIRRFDPTTYLLRVTAMNRVAWLRLSASSIENPFYMPFHTFSCPNTLQ